MTPIFTETNSASPELIELLSKTVLGSNGAQYRHCDISEHIKQIDTPVFLSLVRYKKLLANVAFCKREKDWYVRYFAFNVQNQSKNTRSSQNGTLHAYLKDYFKNKLETNEVESFYAYIDPRNSRSVAMATGFNFKRINSVITQTYSRRNPKFSKRVQKEAYHPSLAKFIHDHFSNLPYSFDAQLTQGTFYVLRDEKGAVLAMTQVHFAHWEWSRLPGRWGRILVKSIPFIPIVNKLFNPKEHQFLVFDTIYALHTRSELLNELFSACLFHENRKSAIWWVHPENSLYHRVQKRIKWGLLHKMNGVHPVDLYVLGKDKTKKQEFYVSGLDFI